MNKLTNAISRSAKYAKKNPLVIFAATCAVVTITTTVVVTVIEWKELNAQFAIDILDESLR